MSCNVIPATARPLPGLFASCLSTAPEDVATVAELYQQHFETNAEVVQHMLRQNYREYPPHLNFAFARTVVLKRGQTTVSAATVRVHKSTSGLRFLEICLFATHKAHSGCGYGGVLSSLLLQKSFLAECTKIVLRATASATSFWWSQGYRFCPETTASQDPFYAYVLTHCLNFPQTCLMYRDLEVQCNWVEYSLAKTQRVAQVLQDCGASVQPMKRASREQPAETPAGELLH
eukprot:RCo013289